MEGHARPVGRPRTTPVPEGYYSDDAIAARRAYHAAYKARNADNLKAYYRAWRASSLGSSIRPASVVLRK